MTACNTETPDYPDGDGDFNLCLSVGLGSPQVSAALSRVVEDGNDAFNENYLDEVSCFFYPQGKENENAVYVIENYSLKTPIKGTIKTNISKEYLDKLFPAGNTTCSVYVVANHKFNVAGLTSTKMDDIKNQVVTSNFKGSATETTFDDESRIQSKFVMDGESADVKVMDDGSTGSKKVYTGQSIPLKRSASKITLTVTVKDEITDEFGASWKSQPVNMRLSLHNGLNKSYINALNYQATTSDYFDTSYSTFKKDNQSNTYLIDVPYYSYPSSWEQGDRDHEAYFVLVLPWAKVKKVGGKEELTYKNCYYQIPINPDGLKLDRNAYYKLNLKVGILGDFDSSNVEPEELTPSYQVIDWGINDVDVVVGDSQYLMADKNYAEMRDVSTLTMAYYTSDPLTSITIDKITYESYRKNTTETVTLTKAKPDSKVGDKNTYTHYTVTWDDTTEHFTFKINHDKVNSLNYYTIQEFDLTLTNQSGLTDKVHLVWYPAIYIIGEKSTSYVWVNNVGGNTTERQYPKSDKNKYGLGSVTIRSGVNGKNDGTNVNQNQYTIYTSTLVEDSPYSIGDTRGVSGKITDFNSSKGLAEYRRSSPDAEMMVAPIFKIASSYGKTTPMTHENAERRCASYQENGYPAGRWRVPTKGEIQFVVELSATYKVIPSLFDGEYWSSATNTYFSSNTTEFKTGNSNTEHAVRCVYDVWYWGDKKIKELNPSHENNEPHWSNEYK